LSSSAALCGSSKSRGACSIWAVSSFRKVSFPGISASVSDMLQNSCSLTFRGSSLENNDIVRSPPIFQYLPTLSKSRLPIPRAVLRGPRGAPASKRDKLSPTYSSSCHSIGSPRTIIGAFGICLGPHEPTPRKRGPREGGLQGWD
jgi:hypothetical protein